MCNIAWDLWEHRNGTTHSTNTKRACEATTHTVNEVLSKGPPTIDLAPLFSEEEQLTLQSATEAYKKAWLAAVQSHDGFRKRKQRSELSRMQQFLRQYIST